MKKIDLLQEELNKFKKILNYNNINEASYKFYNEAEEMEPEDNSNQNLEPQDQSIDEPVQEPVDEPAPQPGQDQSNNSNANPPQPGDMDQSAAIDPNMGVVEEPADDTTEIDVTEIINKLQDSSSKIDVVIDKVREIEIGLGKMDGIIHQIGELGRQVELMRPPTEDERRKALADKSYPYNVTTDEMINGTGTKNQTDLEKRKDKMSMMDNLMANYNKDEVKRSFYPSEGIDNEQAKYF